MNLLVHFPMKNIILITLSVLCCFFLNSCLDSIDAPLRQETSQLVLEGLITNDPKFQYLRLSQTTSFGTANTPRPIRGAYVEVRSSSSKVTVFYAVPNEVGLYRPEDSDWAGTVGESYSVYIKLPNERVYQSAFQKMPSPVEITNLNATFVTSGTPGFETSVSFKDPSETENYYRWTGSGFHTRKSTGVPTGGTICCNRCWVLKTENAINPFSDLLVNGSLAKNRPVFLSPFYAIGRHFIEIQQFSITKEAFLFWTRFKDQQQRTGTIFDPLPAALTGNVVNINNPQDVALGFFEVSSLTRKRISPNATTQAVLAISFDNPLFVPEGDCLLAFPFSVYDTENPPGW
jgi:hypothetical protein